MHYDFANLSPSEFEDLARDLIGREIGVRFEVFPTGPDDGMDGRHTDAAGSIVLQAKHYGRSGFSALKSKMTKERKAIDRLAPKRYILATSAALTPKNKAALQEIIGPSLLGTADILGPGDLNGLLHKFPDIERAHQKLWATSSAVFEAIVTGVIEKALGKPQNGLWAPDRLLKAPAVVTSHTRQSVNAKVASAHLALKFDPSMYVRRSLEGDVGDWLATPRSKSSTCFLVLAPAGSGKTNLLCSIADISSQKRPTALLVGGQLRIGGNAGLWTSVLESYCLPSLPEYSRGDQVAIVTQLAKVVGGCAVIIDAINEHPDPIGSSTSFRPSSPNVIPQGFTSWFPAGTIIGACSTQVGGPRSFACIATRGNQRGELSATSHPTKARRHFDVTSITTMSRPSPKATRLSSSATRCS